MKAITIEAYFDGACEPVNPCGNMGIGAYIINKKSKKTLFEYAKFIPRDEKNSNNVAEYLGLIRILEYLIEKGYHDSDSQFYIFGDSKLVIEQMKGNWGMKGGRYIEYARTALSLIINFKHINNLKFIWIPRELNSRADDLSKSEMIKNKVKFKIQPQ